MKRIGNLVEHELKWTQPRALTRGFELRDGDAVAATLVFRSLISSFATVETADGSWTFKRVGFFRPHVTICVAGSESEIATFKNDTWTAGGSLILPDGRSYRANSNFWQSKFEFTNETEEPLVRFQKLGVVHLSAMVEITRAGVKLRELPWLVALGMYLIVKMQDDAGCAAAATAG
jgi:hypothetical protein